MIKLTKVDGTPLYPVVEHIIEIDVSEGDTVVRTSKDGYYVTESPKEVVRKIMEYKLAMASYSKYLPSNDLNKRKYILRLAGLEESPDV